MGKMTSWPESQVPKEGSAIAAQGTRHAPKGPGTHPSIRMGLKRGPYLLALGPKYVLPGHMDSKGIG